MITEKIAGATWILLLTVVGTGLANILTKNGSIPIEGLIIVISFISIGLVSGARGRRGLYSLEGIAWIIMLLLPLVFMLLSTQEYNRGIWTSHWIYLVLISMAIIFSSKYGFNKYVGIAALCALSVSVLANVYELFNPNMWSESPGRSAGFFVNPNISAVSIIGYGLLLLSTNIGKNTAASLMILAMVFLGVASTFSRSGFIIFAIVFGLHYWFKLGGKATKLMSVSVVTAVLVTIFFFFIVPSIELTDDSSKRISSFTEGTVKKDFKKERIHALKHGLSKFNESPLTGNGARASFEKTRTSEGPHNMFVGVAVDFGILGLVLYVVLVVKVFLNGFKLARREVQARMFVLPFAVWLFLYSLVSHNVIYEPSVLLMLPFAFFMPNRPKRMKKWRDPLVRKV